MCKATLQAPAKTCQFESGLKFMIGLHMAMRTWSRLLFLTHRFEPQFEGSAILQETGENLWSTLQLILSVFPWEDKTVLGPASPWNRFWRDFLEVWGVGGSEANFLEVCFGFHLEISTRRHHLRSLGPFRKLPPEPPRTSDMSVQELFQSRGWLEDHLRRRED